MFAVEIVALARAGTEQIGVTTWLPVLPSYHAPLVEWAPGESVAVARVEFPNWDPDRPTEGVRILAAGELDDTERQRRLDRGWTVRRP